MLAGFNSYVLTGRNSCFNKAIHVLLQNLLQNYIYTLSGPPCKAHAKPSDQHEKMYLTTARIEDIYKKHARLRKMVVRLKNKLGEHFLNFRCVVVEFMQ